MAAASTPASEAKPKAKKSMADGKPESLPILFENKAEKRQFTANRMVDVVRLDADPDWSRAS